MTGWRRSRGWQCRVGSRRRCLWRRSRDVAVESISRATVSHSEFSLSKSQRSSQGLLLLAFLAQWKVSLLVNTSCLACLTLSLPIPIYLYVLLVNSSCLAYLTLPVYLPMKLNIRSHVASVFGFKQASAVLHPTLAPSP